MTARRCPSCGWMTTKDECPFCALAVLMRIRIPSNLPAIPADHIDRYVEAFCRKIERDETALRMRRYREGAY